MSDVSWRATASCRGLADLFFPVRRGSSLSAAHRYDDEVAIAKLICSGCPARMPCLEYALVHREESGIWGGTDEDERRRLQKLWNRQRTARAS